MSQKAPEDCIYGRCRRPSLSVGHFCEKHEAQARSREARGYGPSFTMIVVGTIVAWEVVGRRGVIWVFDMVEALFN